MPHWRHVLWTCASVATVTRVVDGMPEDALCGRAPPATAADAALELFLRLPETERSRLVALASQDAGSNVAEKEDTEREVSSVGAAFLAVCLLFILRLTWILYKEWKRYLSKGGSDHGNYRAYLKYRFCHWYAWTPGAPGIVLCALSLALMVCGGLLLCLVTGESLSPALWAAWIWIVAPDGGNSQETRLGCFVGLIVSCGGMLIFAMLMSVVSCSLEGMLTALQEGRAPVLEFQHCVILGWNAMIYTLIEELCNASECRGGMVIALLAPLPKLEIEAALAECDINLRNSVVVVRCGDSNRQEDLAKVNVEHASTVIILSKPDVSREDADARTSRVLLTMRTMRWPRQGACIVECQLPRNRRLFCSLCPSPASQVLATGDFVGRLTAQCSRQQGLGGVVKSLLGFEGDEIYLAQVQGVEGFHFGDMIFALPGVVPLGLVPPEGQPMLLPPMDYRLRGTEQLILLAEDETKLPSKVPNTPEVFSEGFGALDCKGKRALANHGCSRHKSSETVFIMGWNESIGAVMFELDTAVLGAGSRAIIYSPKAECDRTAFLENAQRRRGHRFENIAVEQRAGPLGARLHLEDLPLEDTSKILILADDSASSSAEADGHTIAVMLQVLDILAERTGSKSSAVIVPQILERASHKACENLGIVDFIDYNVLAAGLMTLVSQSPALNAVISELLSGTCEIRIAELGEYLPAGNFTAGVSFEEASRAAAVAGEIALGWSAEGGSWDLNPKDKMARRPWTHSACLVILGHAAPLRDAVDGGSASKRGRLE